MLQSNHNYDPHTTASDIATKFTYKIMINGAAVFISVLVCRTARGASLDNYTT